jgi:hypothetical protein
MTTERQKIQKKKARQKVVQAKLRHRREINRSVEKEKRDDIRAQKKFKKDQLVMEKLEEKMEELYSKLPPDTRMQLERNIEILKALEEEYDQEIAKKQNLNQELELQGNLTPEEKMKALHEKAVKQQKEIVDVEVIKATKSE